MAENFSSTQTGLLYVAYNDYVDILERNNRVLAEKHVIRIGECKRCGRCCECSRNFKIENDVIMFTGETAEPCEAFDPETRLCREYDRRPDICRYYPYSQETVLIKECGYSFK